MNNNDILRRLRYAFDFSDGAVVNLFGLAERVVTREQVAAWLRRDEDPELQPLSDTLLAAFLDGFIAHKRGKREGALTPPKQQMNNNVILRKLRIALSLQDSDVLEIMALADMPLGKAELSALFRAPDHRHYRACQDQILRRFLQGLRLKVRPSAAPEEA
jgi:uncharacterized protein YehS (DUF1456 family)